MQQSWLGMRLRRHCGSADHVLSETRTSVESKLDPAAFMRVHRSTIVKSSRVVAVHAIVGGSYELELRGGVRMRTGRQYRGRIRKLLDGSGAPNRTDENALRASAIYRGRRVGLNDRTRLNVRALPRSIFSYRL